MKLKRGKALLKYKNSTTLFFTMAAVFWMLVIFISSAQPATQSKELSSGVTEIVIETVERIAPDKTAQIDVGRLHHLVRKNAHFFSYLILGVLVLEVTRRYGNTGMKGVLIAFLICVIYAISDEIHQAFVPGRGPQLSDVLLDSAGAAVGIGLYFFVRKIAYRISTKLQVS